MNRRKPAFKKCYNCGTQKNLFLNDNKYSCQLCAREIVLPADEHWTASAACKGSALDFYSEDKNDIFMAKLICVGCPVRAICLEEAMKTKERYGVWGGTSEQERDALFRRWRPQHMIKQDDSRPYQSSISS